MAKSTLRPFTLSGGAAGWAEVACLIAALDALSCLAALWYAYDNSSSSTTRVLVALWHAELFSGIAASAHPAQLLPRTLLSPYVPTPLRSFHLRSPPPMSPKQLFRMLLGSAWKDAYHHPIKAARFIRKAKKIIRLLKWALPRT